MSPAPRDDLLRETEPAVSPATLTGKQCSPPVVFTRQESKDIQDIFISRLHVVGGGGRGDAEIRGKTREHANKRLVNCLRCCEYWGKLGPVSGLRVPSFHNIKCSTWAIKFHRSSEVDV